MVVRIASYDRQVTSMSPSRGPMNAKTAASFSTALISSGIVESEIRVSYIMIDLIIQEVLF